MRVRPILTLLALTIIITGLPAGVTAGPPLSVAGLEHKLKGGMAEMIKHQNPFDERLRYLLEDYQPGELAYWVMLDHAPTAADAHAIEERGAGIRWQFRSIPAFSVRSLAEDALRIAALDGVEYLYPLRSFRRLTDTSQAVSGTITRANTPQEHPITVPPGTTKIIVDLTVAPPVPPTFDFNLNDYPQAILYHHNRAMATRPATGDQIAFEYSRQDVGDGLLGTDGWRLTLEYRNANNPPPAGTTYTYNGAVETKDDAVTRPTPAPIPGGACAGPANVNAWRQNPNLKKRGLTDIGTVQLWQQGIRGKGVRVAIADTGIDDTHIDLDDQDFQHWGQAGCPPKVLIHETFAGGQRLGFTPDNNGHGTATSSETAGTAEAHGPGSFPGVAPEASLIDAKISPDLTGLNDDIMAGLEWAIIEQQADVVNLSFGIDVRFGVLNDEHDPQAIASNMLVSKLDWGYPTLAVAAGNSGDIFDSVGVPASASQVITAAASVKDWDVTMPGGAGEEPACTNTDREGVADAQGKFHPAVADFSSRGPSQDFLLKPQISAPGVFIASAESNFQEGGDPPLNGYWCPSGTSMAAPHTAGAAALLVDAYRQAFGTSGPYRNRPPGFLVKAALIQTTHRFAPRPADLAIPANGNGDTIDYGAGAQTNGVIQLYGRDTSREANTPDTNNDPVGSLAEGAGRINLPAAKKALTQGVLLYTPPEQFFFPGGAPDAIQIAGQPVFDGRRLRPASSTTRQFIVDRTRTGTFSVGGWTSNPGAPSREVKPIPASWLTLPGTTTITGSNDGQLSVRLAVPPSAAPGYYSTYLFANVTGPSGFSQVLRMPVFVTVEMRDTSVGAAVSPQGSFEGKILALQPSVFPGNPGLLTGASSDYPIFPFRVSGGAQQFTISAWVTETGLDELDLFLYGDTSNVIAHTYEPVPGPPTLAASPATLTVTLQPGLYIVAVNNTFPECPELTCDWEEVPYKLVLNRTT